MRREKWIAGIAAAALTLLTACGIGTGLGGGAPSVLNPVEAFTEDDRPEALSVAFDGDSFDLEAPWGYARRDNASRHYPIVVNGCWGEGHYFGEETRKKYPAFFLDFNNHSSEGDGGLLADLLDALSESYRIDMDRVYLTGFSAGGSGSFKLARGMLAKGKLFAAIMRVAGQSESVLAEEAAARTSLWYHIGLADTSNGRLDIARSTYAGLKARAIDEGAVESASTDSITGYPRSTWTLAKGGVEIVKYSEYDGMGHTPGPCYKDPALFDWLFCQSLALRRG